MVHATHEVGLFSSATEYSDAACRDARLAQAAAARLLATSYRHSAKRLRESNEGGGVPDGAILLEQLADEIDPD